MSISSSLVVFYEPGLPRSLPLSATFQSGALFGREPRATSFENATDKNARHETGHFILISLSRG